MNLKKLKPTLLLVAILIISRNSSFEFEDVNYGISDNYTHPASADIHDPIMIDGNAALATFIGVEGLNGDGTYDTPYRIENFTIEASTAYGIEIRNTNTYFIIQNCTISGGMESENYGILLSSVINANISNNDISYNYRGIYLNNTNNTILSGNTANYNHINGIELNASNNNTLTGNIACYNDLSAGIYLRLSNNTIVSGNIVNNNAWGFYFHHTNNNTIFANIANYNDVGGIPVMFSNNTTLSENNASYNNHFGIGLYNSSTITVSRNFANFNTIYGIYQWISSNNILSENTANNNSWIGIHLFPANHNNILFGNTANFNTQHGIELYSSKNNTLFGNIAIYNAGHGIHVWHNSTNNTIYSNDIFGNYMAQASEGEDCTDNQWDNGTIGNYWGNTYFTNNLPITNDGIVWNMPHEIDGNGSGMDHFPLVNPIFLDLESPYFIDNPQDFSSEEGYTGLKILWPVFDSYPATYTIFLNGTEVASNITWTSNAILYEIPEGLIEGNYNITVIVLDENGNRAQNTVMFTVDPMEKIPGFPLVNIFALLSITEWILLKKRKKETLI